MSELPTGTVTFLFTDIEGSTRLWETQPDAMRLVLSRHDTILRGAIETNGGHVFKTMGDQFCAAFATAGEAVDAALAIQQQLHPTQILTLQLPEPLRVRVALHTGAAELSSGGDYFGPPLNRVSRLLPLAHGGQVLLSSATQVLAQDDLPPGATLSDLGNHRLRDLQRPERIFQLLHPDLPSDFPPLRSLDARPHNLPVQTTSFVGREKELGEIRRLLEKSRLLTLTGAGGCGKSRLSQQLAAEVLDSFPDGVWVVELAALGDPILVPQAVATVLNLKEEPGRPVVETLMRQLKSRALLLLLDNCEHLLTACAGLADSLLRHCPSVRLLITSRHPLIVAGETTYRVPSLTVPDRNGIVVPESLIRCQAVQLFIERAVAALPGFTVTSANAPAVAEICWRLDGIPLALELAAARVRALSVETIQERLSDRFRLLTGGSRMALPRLQTLRATVDWSYELLTDLERVLLRRLSAFAGGWTLEAAEAVGAGDPIQASEVLDLLTGLVEKSLVAWDEGITEIRYGFLETVRLYARERLQESGEAPQVQERHLRHFINVAERTRWELQGPEQAHWLRALDADHDNMRAALACSRETGQSALGIRLGTALWRYWHVRGYQREGRQWLTELVETGRATTTLELTGRALMGLSCLAHDQGDHIEARARSEESLCIFRDLGSRSGVATSLMHLGICAISAGDYSAASRYLDESLALRREMDSEHNRRELAHVLNNRGYLAYWQRDYALARTFLEESLALRLRMSDKQGISASMNTLALVVQAEGDTAASISLLRQAIYLAKDIGCPLTLAYSFDRLAGIAAELGDLRRAARLYGAAAALRSACGFHLSGVEETDYRFRIAALRTSLGVDDLESEWHSGQNMGWDEAIFHALDDVVPR